MAVSGKTFLSAALCLIMSGPVFAQTTPPPPRPTEPAPTQRPEPTRKDTPEARELEKIDQELREKREKLEQELKEDLKAGVEAMQAGDYVTAEEKFAKILNHIPDHPETNYLMARVKLQNGQIDECVDYLKVAVRENGEFVEARELLALIEVSRGNKDEAQDQLSDLKKMRDKCQRRSSCTINLVRLNEAIVRIENALAARG